MLIRPSGSSFSRLIPSDNDASRADGRGKGVLYFLGLPYWFAGSDSALEPFEWTWVDLLEHVASHWAALVFEQAYPYAWLKDVAHPGDVWRTAELRWARLGDDIAEAEEIALLAFERRHNLGAAWKGLSLPSLVLTRSGALCWICAEGRDPVRASFHACRTEFIAVCDALAAWFEGSSNARVANAVRLWRHREMTAKEGFFTSVTGMPQSQLLAIQGRADPLAFWGVAANDGWAQGLVEEGPLLAAARMTAGIADAVTVRRVVEAIRAVPKGSLEALDRFTAQVRQRLRKTPSQSQFSGEKFAFAGDYAAAQAVREVLLRDQPAKFAIEEVCEVHGIQVRQLSLGIQIMCNVSYVTACGHGSSAKTAN